MQIIHDFLTENEYSRPGKKLQKVLAVVIHWTANPVATAKQNRDFFEAKKTGMGGYASAHYIIGQDGEIIQCIPENEVAYHCGTNQKDPASGQFYTDYARKKFGHYAVHWQTTSPNYCTIPIELCPTDYDGNFTEKTINAAIDLCTYLCKRHNLAADDITTHHDVVGWKNCPKLWTEKPQLLEAFRQSVADKIQRG